MFLRSIAPLTLGCLVALGVSWPRDARAQADDHHAAMHAAVGDVDFPVS